MAYEYLTLLGATSSQFGHCGAYGTGSYNNGVDCTTSTNPATQTGTTTPSNSSGGLSATGAEFYYYLGGGILLIVTAIVILTTNLRRKARAK